jgi:hypothetical protein
VIAGTGPKVSGGTRPKVIATAPRRQGLEPLLLPLGKDGRVADPRALERLEREAPGASDCFVFCHGWLYDQAEAQQEAARFFALLEAALAPLRGRIIPLRVALHWPSKPFADPELTRHPAHGSSSVLTRGTGHPGLWPELERRLAAPSYGGAKDVERLLDDLGAAEVPLSVEEEAEIDALMGSFGDRASRGVVSPLHVLSFWAMKRRAGEVGERLGRERLGPLWASLQTPPRLHLIGHSFGAKLLASAVLGGARATSLTLLLAAFSAFAFAPEVAGLGRPGFYHRILAARLVDDPVVVLRSTHDKALGVLYGSLTGSGGADRARGRDRGAARATSGRAGHGRMAVAASALGAVGARGVGAPEVDLCDVPRIGIPRYPIVNVDGSQVITASETLVGAHRDIYHPEVATLVLLAAGLLQPGPEGLRPARVSPLGSA